MYGTHKPPAASATVPTWFSIIKKFVHKPTAADASSGTPLASSHEEAAGGKYGPLSVPF